MSDYKYEMQMIAEQVAYDDYGCDFFDLSSETQYNIFRKAEDTWSENMMAEAESLSDRLKER
jgi:hypothetical protein